MSINGFKRKFCKERREVTIGKYWLIFNEKQLEWCETLKEYMILFDDRTLDDYHWFKCKNCQYIDDFLEEIKTPKDKDWDNPEDEIWNGKTCPRCNQEMEAHADSWICVCGIKVKFSEV